MDISRKTDSQMEASKTWGDVLDLIEKVTPWLTTGAILWKVIDKIAAYWSDKRKSELEGIVDKKMKPHIDNLSEKIENLSDAIWALKNKKD